MSEPGGIQGRLLKVLIVFDLCDDLGHHKSDGGLCTFTCGDLPEWCLFSEVCPGRMFFPFVLGFVFGGISFFIIYHSVIKKKQNIANDDFDLGTIKANIESMNKNQLVFYSYFLYLL